MNDFMESVEQLNNNNEVSSASGLKYDAEGVHTQPYMMEGMHTRWPISPNDVTNHSIWQSSEFARVLSGFESQHFENQSERSLNHSVQNFINNEERYLHSNRSGSKEPDVFSAPRLG